MFVNCSIVVYFRGIKILYIRPAFSSGLESMAGVLCLAKPTANQALRVSWRSAMGDCFTAVSIVIGAFLFTCLRRVRLRRIWSPEDWLAVDHIGKPLQVRAFEDFSQQSAMSGPDGVRLPLTLPGVAWCFPAQLSLQCGSRAIPYFILLGVELLNGANDLFTL